MESSNSAVKTACDIQVDGKCGPVRPKMTWKQLTERDCREWKLLAIDSHNGVRSVICAASQQPGRGPLMWMLPLYLHVNKKFNDEDDDKKQKHNGETDNTKTVYPPHPHPAHQTVFKYIQDIFWCKNQN